MGGGRRSGAARNIGAGRRETINFAKYNCERVYKNGKNNGAYCKSCKEVFAFKEEHRLKTHYKVCPGIPDTSSDSEDGRTEEDGESLREIDNSSGGPSFTTPTTSQGQSSTPGGRNFTTPTTSQGQSSTPTCRGGCSSSHSTKRKRRASPPSPPKATLIRFFDSCNEKQEVDIKQQILKFFIANEIKFEIADHSTFINLMSTMRPQFINHFEGSKDLKATVPVLYDNIMKKYKDDMKNRTGCTVKATFAPEINACLLMTDRNTFLTITDYFDINYQNIINAVSILNLITDPFDSLKKQRASGFI